MESGSLGISDSDTSEDEVSPGKSSSTQELERTPSERHAFLFRHNLGPSNPDTSEFYPPQSHLPLLLDVFSDNVNAICQIVHLPTIWKMVHGLADYDMTSLKPAHEALILSICYAAITSMEDDDVSIHYN